MNAGIRAMVEPLVSRKLFPTEEAAVRSLLREYILQQVSQLQQELSSLESKYGMSFEQFTAYVHERSVFLEEVDLTPEQRKAYGTTFEDFIDNRVVRQQGYTWEAETDAMDWETAVDGMETMRRKLQELQDVQQK